MRIAAVSDIHSNVFALEAVLSDIDKRGADLTVNLGDILYGPIAPRATYEMLMERNLTSIRGNQDRQIYQATKAEIASNPTMQFIYDDLGPEPLAWMRHLPFSCQLNESVFLCHGTPSDDLIYLLEDVQSGHPTVRSEQDILSLLDGQHSKVIMCGHTHIPRSVSLSRGQLIVNPGSVGLPAYTDDLPMFHSMENYSPDASYAIVENNKNGWSVEHIKVAYAYEKAAAESLKRNRPDWGHFLTTGRACCS